MGGLLQRLFEKAFVGLRALVFQNYTEANVKNGVQYEYELIAEDLAAGANADIIVLTGSKHISIKGFSSQFDDSGFERVTYENPIYTGGIPFEYYNKNYSNPVAGEMQILAGANITDIGIQVSAKRRFIGIAESGNKIVTTQVSPTVGLETILAPNTAYLIRTTNLASSTQNIISYVTWYEGDLDLPVKDGDV